MFDVTMILQGLLVLLVALAAYKLWPAIKAAVPTVVVKFIQTVAHFAVYAVEADFGSGNGDKKLDAALDLVKKWFERFHLTFDADMIKTAIKEEWYKLDVEQIEGGMKKIE